MEGRVARIEQVFLFLERIQAIHDYQVFPEKWPLEWFDFTRQIAHAGSLLRIDAPFLALENTLVSSPVGHFFLSSITEKLECHGPPLCPWRLSGKCGLSYV